MARPHKAAAQKGRSRTRGIARRTGSTRIRAVSPEHKPMNPAALRGKRKVAKSRIAALTARCVGMVTAAAAMRAVRVRGTVSTPVWSACLRSRKQTRRERVRDPADGADT